MQHVFIIIGVDIKRKSELVLKIKWLRMIGGNDKL